MTSPEVRSPEVAEVIIELGHNKTPLRGSREWVFTINNPSEADHNEIREANSRYTCYAPEVGTQGTQHLQGYIVFQDNKTRSAVSKILTRAWLAPRSPHSSPAEARQYIVGPYSKNGKEKPKNPDAWEVGQLPSQGKRTDLVAFHRAIQEGKRGPDLSVDHLAIRAKYPKLEQTLIFENDRIQARRDYDEGITREVHVRWGPPRSGKTRYVYENFSDVFEPEIKPYGQHWWTGYQGQEVVLLDEFDGQIPIRDFLRITDRYPWCVGTKGGHVWLRAKKIFICSNTNPKDWYPGEAHQYEKIFERFTTCLYIEKKDGNPIPTEETQMVRDQKV